MAKRKKTYKIPRTFEAESGQVFKIREVNLNILQTFMTQLAQLGAGDFLNNPESMAQLSPESQAAVLPIMNSMLDYCLGWGVESEPEPEEIDHELLQMMHIDLDQKKLIKGLWLKQILPNSDASKLMGTIMALTYRPEIEIEDDAPEAESAPESAPESVEEKRARLVSEIEAIDSPQG